MKNINKLVVVSVVCILFFNITQCMYDQGSKLKYSEIKLTNKSPIDLELSWTEIKRPEGTQQRITREIKAGEAITIKIGEIGGYYMGSPAKISYKPIPGNEVFKQEFIIDLPNTKEFGFTAVKLADILNNIWVPGMLQIDDKDKLTFQYMNTNIHGTEELQKTISATSAIKKLDTL